MNPIVFHIVSGEAYFTGILLVLVAASSKWHGIEIARKIKLFTLVIGILLLAMTALPTSQLEWLALIAFIFVSVFLTIRRGVFRNTEVINVRLKALTLLMQFCCCPLLISMELSWRLPSSPPLTEITQITLLGDSLSAGMGEGEAVTWPKVFEVETGITIHDYSRMGATVGSELQRLEKYEMPKDGIILCELGGNDILGSTSTEDFRKNLTLLCDKLTSRGQTVYMLELPIPPLFNRFGIAQRQVSRQFGVQLIPKRRLLKVLAHSGATLDSIHLSQSGHNLMAATMQDSLGIRDPQ